MAKEKHVFTFNEEIADPFVTSFASAAGSRPTGDAIDSVFLGSEELSALTFCTYWIPSRALLRGPAALVGAILGGTIGRGTRSLVKTIAENR